MGFYSRHILPALIELAMRQPVLRPYRERAIAAAAGDVVEIGVGSGFNLPLYRAPAHRVAAIEPSPALLRRAALRAAAAAVPVALIEGSAEALPFAAGSIDTVVTTWTLCTIPDVARALREMRRVLRPDGRLLFVEHGRASDPRVARWQDRLDPLWSRLAGGCHLNRRIDALLREAGFAVAAVANPLLPGLPTHGYLYEGTAIPA
jgi:ubiquinone/menaquinone biosynthesis C-methylase UbiE